MTPRLRHIPERELPAAHAMAREDAAAAMRDHGEQEAADSLPPACPYTIEQVLGSWLP